MTILFSALLTLSACGHLKSEAEISPHVPPPSAQNEQSEPPLATDNDSDATSLEEVEVGDSAPLETTETDLLARIRAGFSLPDFKSKHVAQYERWSSRHPTYLQSLFTRAEPFLFHIVEEIEKRGLPMELVLLPAIESAYKPNAVSRSKAVGLWQFISSTGEYYGLRQNWWYDGRRDAIAATDAALEYLTALNQMFDGDWLLTMAAYNGGPGTINKALKANRRKNRGTRFEDLRLRSETERYVPKLFALRNIISNPEKFSVTLPTIANQPYFEVISLPGQIDIHEFAEQSGIELASLQHMNAGFRRWATAPDGPHRLLVPRNALEQVSPLLEQLAANPPVQYRDHRISRGETLSGIARRYGVSVSALKSANQMQSTSIRAGRTLLVPIVDRIAGQNLAAISNNSGAGVAPSAPTETGKLIHRVVAGDTLWSIARRYQVEVSQLLSWNKLADNQILSLDQALLVILNN
ncbi:MAG: LysM peptidoglycan-binding domain-containing protein [Pseudomonadota bacterium]